MLRLIKIIMISSALLSLSACQHQFELTNTQPTEAALVANAINNGMEIELEINYLEAYKNLGGVSKSMLKKSRLNFDKIEKCK